MRHVSIIFIFTLQTACAAVLQVHTEPKNCVDLGQVASESPQESQALLKLKAEVSKLGGNVLYTPEQDVTEITMLCGEKPSQSLKLKGRAYKCQ